MRMSDGHGHGLATRTDKVPLKAGPRGLKKPEFAKRLIPQGAILAIDGGSLIGHCPPEYAREVCSGSIAILKAWGYRPEILLEHRAMRWASFLQKTKARALAFAEYFSSGDVQILTEGDADLPVLQRAEGAAMAYAISRDHFKEFETAFPRVFEMDRVRRFNVFKTKNEICISIIGIKDQIRIPIEPIAEEDEDSEKSDGYVERRRFRDAATRNVCGAALNRGDAAYKRGEMEVAAKQYGRIMDARDSRGFFAAAQLASDCGNARDSLRYEKIGIRMLQREKDAARRKLRQGQGRNRCVAA